MTSSRPRDLLWQACFVLKVVADLQLYLFEPECVPNPEDSEVHTRLTIGLKTHFGALVSDVKSCQCEKNVFLLSRKARGKKQNGR